MLNDHRHFLESLEAPEELDRVIKNAIGRGKITMRRKRQRAKIFRLAFGLLATLLATFTISVNVLPAFAESLRSFPGTAGLVKLLQFDRGKASGGDITDGQDVRLISWEAQKGFERITLDYSAAGETGLPVGAPGFFEIIEEQYPYRLVFHLGGIRGFSALNQLPDLTGSRLVEDLHQVIILDDQMVGFAITLKQPVQVTVREQNNPARIIIDLAADPAAELPGTAYTVRSTSRPFGGGLGEIVATLQADGEQAAMLRDRAGTYVVQAGYYLTEAEALAAKERIEQIYGLVMHVERRGPTERPAPITD